MDSSKLHVERALLKDNLLSENYKRTQKKVLQLHRKTCFLQHSVSLMQHKDVIYSTLKYTFVLY